MGHLAQSPLANRSGIALPTSILALTGISVLVAGMFAVTDLGQKATRNRERAARAVQVAEAGAAHALGTLRRELSRTAFTRLLRGNDNLPNTPDDGRLTAYAELQLDQQIPDTGKTVTLPGGISGGRYSVQLVDDPSDPTVNPLIDGNGRILARCRGETPDGAVAEIEAIIGAQPMPGIAVDGHLDIPGNIQLTGPCGGIHTNGNLHLTGSSIVETELSATGAISGDAEQPGGAGPTPEVSGPVMDIPALNPMDYCGNADFRLKSTGYVLVIATGLEYDARSVSQFGWKRSGPGLWVQDGPAVAGTICAEGNVDVSTAIGTAASPLPLSIIASGSVKISGSPYITADDPDAIMILAGGDVDISGDPVAGGASYTGMIYSGAQCKVSGAPAIYGQLICDSKPNPPGATQHATKNEISGDAQIFFDCNGNIFNKRRIFSWYQRIGT